VRPQTKSGGPEWAAALPSIKVVPPVLRVSGVVAVESAFGHAGRGAVCIWSNPQGSPPRRQALGTVEVGHLRDVAPLWTLGCQRDAGTDADQFRQGTPPKRRLLAAFGAQHSSSRVVIGPTRRRARTRRDPGAGRRAVDRIAAIPQAITRTTPATEGGTTVSQNRKRTRPLGLTLVPERRHPDHRRRRRKDRRDNLGR
jgi:hypothetical protein